MVSRVLGYHPRKRRTLMQAFNDIEATLVDLARRFGPLPGANSGPAAGSAALAAT